VQDVYYIHMYTVVSPLGQECCEKYYGHEVVIKLCTGYAILKQIINVFTQFRTRDSYARNFRNN
jgi:hypothetical protein